MRKIRVVEFSYGMGFGGTEKVLYLFCKYIDSDRFDISVCTMEGDKQSSRVKAIQELGIDVHFSSISRLELKDYFKSLQADILHIHRSGNAQKGIITAAKDAGIPIIIEHNVFGYVDNSEENDLIDCHIFVSYSCAWRYQMYVGRPLVSSRYEVLYNPVEVDLFDQFSFDNRDFTRKAIGRIGRDVNEKWDFDFLEALPIIVKEFPDLEFHVIGMTPEVYANIQKMGCGQNLVLYPMTINDNDIMSFYSNISLLTHFARRGETFGLVLAEAMAAKLPVVTHYTPGSIEFSSDSSQAELVNHGYNGFVAINAEMYAASVITLLSDPEVSKELGLHGYNKARACYNAPVITMGLEEIFMNHWRAKGME